MVYFSDAFLQGNLMDEALLYVIFDNFKYTREKGVSKTNKKV
jgi:hypothetical protein